MNWLNDRQIKAAEPKAKKHTLADGGGLCLLVSPRGGKWWRFEYRFGGKKKEMSLGTYPDISLKVARELLAVNRAKVALGVSPLAERKAEKAARSKKIHTFGDTLRSLIADKKKSVKWTASTLEQREYWANHLILPRFGDHPAEYLASPDGEQEIRDFLREIYNSSEKGKSETAKRVRHLMSQAFEHGMALGGRVSRNPINNLKAKDLIPSRKVKHHAAIIVPSRIGDLLRAIDFYGGKPVTRYALKLCPYLFLRSSELRYAEWSELMLEGSEPEWRIPPDRMKMDGYHLIPLARQTVRMFRELHKLTGHGKFLFPNDVHKERVMSETTISSALKAMGFANDEMTHQGFRGTASTRLNELAFEPDVIELQLAHQERDDVRGAYNQAKKIPQRRVMMQVWADQLDNYRERIYDTGQGHIDTRGFDRCAPSSTAAAEDVNSQQTVQVSRMKLLRLLEKTQFSAAQEDVRDYLHSMLLEIDKINAKVSNGEVVIQEASGRSGLRSH